MRPAPKDYLILLGYLLSFFALILSNNSAIVGVLAATFTLILLVHGEQRSLYAVATFSVFSGLVIFAINEFFADTVNTSLLGRGQFALIASLRIFALIAISLAYIRTVDGDLSYEVFSKFLPRSAILTSLSLLLIPRFTESFGVTRHSLRQRGVDISGGKFSFKTLEKLSLLVKAALVNAVEESWTIAESLVHRGYTARRR